MTSTTIDAGDDLPLTVGALLRARASEHGSRPFVVCDDDVLHTTRLRPGRPVSPAP